MKKLFLGLAAASLALGGASAGHAMAGSSSSQARGEARLAKMLEGRVPGQPQSCIPAMVSRNLQVLDRTALVYDAGSTVWVARPSDPRSLDDSDILVIDRFSSSLCKQDVIRTVDRYTGFMSGVVFLGDFVPYKKLES
ncbi:hypothetical protein [Altericroceibacterium xinjiangense]|uniref:hypothetical protein n=1 Tax=Altericroceibacterium xinjiangense TaxID=762261 RepID=UPI001F49F151|nr:hypothetical protein [Altericroceibacterium xinjiangense]